MITNKGIFVGSFLIFVSIVGFLIGDYQRDYIFPQINSMYDPYSPSILKEEEELTMPVFPMNISQLLDEESALHLSMSMIEDQFYSSGSINKMDKFFYSGEKNKMEEKEGLGKLELPGGDFYLGYWKGNLRHGIGANSLAGGDLFICNWAFDSPHGMGIFTNIEGLTYIGNFIAGTFEGFGMTKFGPITYLGYFKQGEYNGWGIWTDSISGIVYEGQFLDGKKHGIAKVYKNGELVFEGNYKKDKPCGVGWQKVTEISWAVNERKHKIRSNKEHDLSITRGQEEEQQEDPVEIIKIGI